MVTLEFFLEYSQERDSKIWVSGLMSHIFNEHKDDLFAMGQIEDTGTIFMIAVVPKELKLSHVAWDGVQWKKALRHQFAMAFSCYVDIVNLKIWNMFVASNGITHKLTQSLEFLFKVQKASMKLFLTWHGSDTKPDCKCYRDAMPVEFTISSDFLC